MITKNALPWKLLDYSSNNNEIKESYPLSEVFNILKNMSNIKLHFFIFNKVCLSFFLLWNL